MPPQNALSARPPTGAPAAGAEPATAEALGRQLRAALPPMRLHSISIYDREANVRWLSEGTLGPDEHSLVLEALATLSADSGRSCCEHALEDGRIAAFLAVRAPQGHLVGLAMVLVDFVSGGEGLTDRIMSAPTRTIIQKLAVLLRPAGSRTDPTGLFPSLAPAAAPKSAPVPVTEALSPGAVNGILELEPTGTPLVPAGDGGRSRTLTGLATGAVRAVALDSALVTLELLPFAKLRAGGGTQRFEVLPAGAARELRDSAWLDALAVQRLLAWLGAHRAVWTAEPASFTLGLSDATLEDQSFLEQVAAGLTSHGVAPDSIGFEIAEPLCAQRRAQVERFMSGCEKLGCFVAIDDFSLDSAVVPLLRSKALRLVKIDARLTATALHDKLSQAMVLAVVQAVKVLGLHCAAQQVDSQALLQWLGAVGCDFAQGPMLARQQPLEALLGTSS